MGAHAAIRIIRRSPQFKPGIHQQNDGLISFALVPLPDWSGRRLLKRNDLVSLPPDCLVIDVEVVLEAL